MGLHDEAKLDQKFMEFAKLMTIYLNHFPKHEKYGLALEIRRAAYAVYVYIVEAPSSAAGWRARFPCWAMRAAPIPCSTCCAI